MKTITQKMKFRESLLRYAEKNGIQKTCIKYGVNRQYIYRWRKRYDGTLESLGDRSHRPKSHPNQHTEAEIKLIKDMRKRNPNAGLVVFWVKLMQRGYSRTITGLYRVLKRLSQMPIRLPNPKYIAKPYEAMTYPGQRVQVDVKHVPAACITSRDDHRSHKYYQYTAIDEFSRFRYVEGFDEISTFSSATFLEHMLKAFPFAVECVQTDNGPENSPTVSPRNVARPRCLRHASNNVVLFTSSFDLLRPDITEKLNVLIAKITNTFMHHINFILWRILKSSSILIIGNIIISLCVL